MVKNRGQVSIEYLIVVSMVVFFVVSMMGVAYYYSNGIKDQIKLTQLQNFINKIITSSETVFYSGEPSKVTINAYLPSGVEKMETYQNQKGIYVEIRTSSGLNKMFFNSNVKIEIGEITKTEGLKRISIVAKEDKVQMEQV